MLYMQHASHDLAALLGFGEFLRGNLLAIAGGELGHRVSSLAAGM
jgi:hypothetical protein